MGLLRTAALLAGLALALPATAAAAPPPWQSAERIQAALFDAQTALLLDGSDTASGVAERRVRAAARALRGPLAAGLRSAGAREAASATGRSRLGPGREARSALRGASAAVLARDDIALAAARGRLRAALMRGSYAVTLVAVRHGDSRTAARWLLLREFRKATRFTRPGADATTALRELGGGRLSPAHAALAVTKDLLDAYQSRLLDELAEAAAANERGFRSRRAEAAAIAAGYFEILAGEYERQRSAAALGRARGAFGRLARAGEEGGRLAFARALDLARVVLDGFTAAPFSPAERARRAQQLVRFLDLVPVEYDHGTEDGKVTIPFEIQEAKAFRDGAQAAFGDLEAALAERGRRKAAAAQRELERLERYVDDAGRGRSVAGQDEVEAAGEHAAALLDELFPEEWKESTSQSDFDLIDLTLDRMEAAASAGEWKQAEQARLEAYAFFEFGPELSLRSLAPDVVARVEGLVWFGADGEDGLAKLIAKERPTRELRESRLALDDALRDGAGALGESAGTAEVVTNAAVIVFREGLEAVLILAAVMASLLGAARGRRRPMLVGAGLALVASAITFVLAQTVITSLARYGEKLEAVVGLIAIAVLLLVLNWFFHRVYWTEHISRFHKRRKRLLGLAEGGFVSAQVLGFVLLGFSTVYREGFETVLFLQAVELNSGLFVVLQGVALGGVAVAAVAVATFILERRLPYKRMLIVTGVLLTAVLVIMVGKTTRTLQGVGWLPITPIDADLPYWTGIWLGVFPTIETIVAQLGAAGFVIGSYLLAERLRRPGWRARPTAEGAGSRSARLRRSSAERAGAGAGAAAGRHVGRAEARSDPRERRALGRRSVG
jgi:high-affinity iron transporter